MALTIIFVSDHFMSSYNDEKPVEENPSKFFVFEGADVDVTYTVKVDLFNRILLIINFWFLGRLLWS